MGMKFIRKVLAVIFLVSAPIASSAHDVMTPEQATKYLARLKAMSEACEVKYPYLKDAIARSWIIGWDTPTRELVSGIMQSETFQPILEAARKVQPDADPATEESCKSMYGRYVQDKSADSK